MAKVELNDKVEMIGDGCPDEWYTVVHIDEDNGRVGMLHEGESKELYPEGDLSVAGEVLAGWIESGQAVVNGPVGECVICGRDIGSNEDYITDEDEYGDPVLYHTECIQGHEEDVGGKGQALLQHVHWQGFDELRIWDVTEGTGDNEYEVDGVTYLVLTWDEREALLRTMVEQYCDENVITEVPEHLRYWFDSDGWVEHEMRHGEAHYYIGGEAEYEERSDYDGELYHIFER